MKIIIIDDEELAISGLKALIEFNFKEIQIVATASNVMEAVKQINIHKPDVLLLDINMPEYTGFDLLDMFPTSSFKVIFTTAYDHYAIKAFKYATIDYLLKPIDYNELSTALQKAKNTMLENQHQMDIIKNGLKGTFNKISIATTIGYEFIELDKIIRIEADGNYSIIVLSDKKIVASKALKHYEDLLIDNTSFIRVHASHLINKNHILKYIKADGGSLYMSDHSDISISTRKKQEVLDILNLK